MTEITKEVTYKLINHHLRSARWCRQVCEENGDTWGETYWRGQVSVLDSLHYMVQEVARIPAAPKPAGIAQSKSV